LGDYFPVYLYFGFVLLLTLVILGATSLFPSRKNTVKFMPYESGIQTQTHLLQKRFPLRYYLVALIFLVFDVEVIFLYPWAVVGKQIGAFAFYEMTFFLAALLVGLTYIWRKGGLQWE
jgi:NADH:ubiquinone oxidoreductase subunit 3 (subunit A)